MSSRFPRAFYTYPVTSRRGRTAPIDSLTLTALLQGLTVDRANFEALTVDFAIIN